MSASNVVMGIPLFAERGLKMNFSAWMGNSQCLILLCIMLRGKYFQDMKVL